MEPTKRTGKRAIGINDFIEKKFKELDFDGLWETLFGKPEKNFTMLVTGRPKNGKTEINIAFAKYLTRFGKVYYTNQELKVLGDVALLIKANHIKNVLRQ